MSQIMSHVSHVSHVSGMTEYVSCVRSHIFWGLSWAEEQIPRALRETSVWMLCKKRFWHRCWTSSWLIAFGHAAPSRQVVRDKKSSATWPDVARRGLMIGWDLYWTTWKGLLCIARQLERRCCEIPLGMCIPGMHVQGSVAMERTASIQVWCTLKLHVEGRWDRSTCKFLAKQHFDIKISDIDMYCAEARIPHWILNRAGTDESIENIFTWICRYCAKHCLKP